MERKIGEIFEYKGEWYQCISDTTDDNCNNCFFQKKCSNITGDCSSTSRSDGKSVAFKKLKKVGEPFTSRGRLYQLYKLFDIDNVCGYGFWCVPNYKAKTIAIEIKQTKEDMEEKKLNLKPFDLEAAKSGKPVCTRDWHKARIICFDRKSDTSIVALIMGNNDREEIHSYYKDGKSVRNQEYSCDLMMYPEKKEGWVNVMEGTAGKVYVGNDIYKTEDEAKEGASRFTSKLIASVPIEWEE